MAKFKIRMWKIGEQDRSKFSEDLVAANNEPVLRTLYKTMGYELQILGMEGQEIAGNPLQPEENSQMSNQQMAAYNPAVIQMDPTKFMQAPQPLHQYPTQPSGSLPTWTPNQQNSQPTQQYPQIQSQPKQEPMLFEDGDSILKWDPSAGKMYKKAWVQVDPAEYRINEESKQIEKRDWVEIKKNNI